MEALGRLEEVLSRLSNFCSTAQGEEMYIHADRTYCGPHGLACDPAKLAAVQNWHAPDKVKGV